MAAFAVAIGGQARADDCTLKQFVELPTVPNAYGSPVVSVQINDQPRKMLLATGAPWSTLSAAATAGLKSYTMTTGFENAWTGKRLDKVLRGSLQLGQQQIEDFEFLAMPAGSGGIDGELGENLLRETDVEFDPVAQKVSFFSKDHCRGSVFHWAHQDEEVVDLRIEPPYHQITVPLTLDDHAIRAGIDTASVDTVLSLRAAKRLFDLTPDSPGMIRSGTSHRRDQEAPVLRYRFTSLKMGDIEFKNPTLTLVDRPRELPDLVLGMHELRSLHLYFANEEHKLYVTTAAGDIAARGAPAGGAAAPADHPAGPLERVNAQDRYRNAQIAMKKRDFQSAAADLDQAIAIDPTYAAAYAMRAAVYVATGDRDRAMQALDKAIAQDPNLAVAYYERAILHQRAGDYARAFTDADQAVRLQPKSPQALNNRCWLGAVIGRLESAIADCNAAAALAPNNPGILDSRGFVHLKAGQFDDAIKDYDAALAIRPKMAVALYGRGLAKRGKGDMTGGNADITAAEQAMPGVADRFGK
ncbi:MAG TPA: tetratricopeptide repeat protein [Alphaproteobacteria bacterium]|nr:tetratricopeptide repeat protein [Alphaproteobacteria bacterium]